MHVCLMLYSNFLSLHITLRDVLWRCNCHITNLPSKLSRRAPQNGLFLNKKKIWNHLPPFLFLLLFLSSPSPPPPFFTVSRTWCRQSREGFFFHTHTKKKKRRRKEKHAQRGNFWEVTWAPSDERRRRRRRRKKTNWKHGPMDTLRRRRRRTRRPFGPRAVRKKTHKFGCRADVASCLFSSFKAAISDLCAWWSGNPDFSKVCVCVWGGGEEDGGAASGSRNRFLVFRITR